MDVMYTEAESPPLPLPHTRAQHENVAAAAGVLKSSQSAVTLVGFGSGNRDGHVFPASRAQPSGTCVRACVFVCDGVRVCAHVRVCIYVCVCFVRARLCMGWLRLVGSLKL